MACSSKTAGRRAKQIEIWESWAIVICVWGTFDPLVLEVILGHSVHLSEHGMLSMLDSMLAAFVSVIK